MGIKYNKKSWSDCYHSPIIAIFMIFILCASPVASIIKPTLAAASETIVSIDDTRANFSETIQIPINVSNAKDIGSMDISLKYNSRVLSLLKVGKGSLTSDSMIQSNMTDGTVKIGLIDDSGINGNGSLVILTFEVWGYPGTTTILDLDANANNVTDFSSIPLTISDGLFTVSGLPEDITATVSVNNATGDYGTTVQIPINLSTPIAIGSLDITFKYDPNVLTVENVTNGRLTENSIITNNTEVDGIINIALADSAGINGTGSVVTINFGVWGNYGDTSPLTLDSVEANEFKAYQEIPVIKKSGIFFVGSLPENITATVSVNNASGDYGATVQVPINLSTPIAIGSMEITFKYDPNVLMVESVDNGNLTNNSIITNNTGVDGTIKIAIADSVGINGTGSILLITFRIWGHYGDTSPLTLDSVVANEFRTYQEIPIIKKSGIFTTTGTPICGISVSVANFTGGIGSILQVPIYVSKATDVGSMDIVLSFDPNVLTAKNVVRGDLTAGSYFESKINIDNVSIALVDDSGINGNGTVAIVTFEVNGYAENESELILERIEANDIDTFAPIPVTKINGVFIDLITVTSPNGGEIWYDIQNITWITASDISGIIAPADNLSVEISLYDAYTYKIIASNLSSTGFYLWNSKKLADGSDVPDGSCYKIDIKATYPDSISSYDLSDNWFTIYNTREVLISSPYGQTTTEKVNATYLLSLFNKQPITDTFDLSVKNIDGASVAELNRSSITIPAWATRDIILDVTDDSPGVYDVVVNATSQTNESVTSEVLIPTEVTPSFSVDIDAPITATSLGGVLTYKTVITNHQKISDIFGLNVTGINTTWFSIGSSCTLMPGERKTTPLVISIPDNASTGNFTVEVYATSFNINKTRNVSAPLTVVKEPIIFDLSPANNTCSGSRDVLFSWKTSVNSTTNLFIKSENETEFNHMIGTPGISHAVSVKNLTRNTWYTFYVMSNSLHGATTSELRNLLIDNGITFDQRTYNVTVERDYDQRVSISVTNTDNKPHDLLVSVNSSYDDLYVGFVGEGSSDQMITLYPSQRKYLTLAIHAQDAIVEDYVLLLNLTNLGEEEIHDYARVNLHVHHPYINFTLEEVSTDPITLAKTLRIKNYGDTITDLRVYAWGNLSDILVFNPSIDHYRLWSGSTVTFDAKPVLTEDFTGANGTITAEGVRTMVNLSVNYTLPDGKNVYIGRVPDVSIKFSEIFDNDDSPNTNPLEGEVVDSYLINDTKVFMSQIIVEVYQDGKLAYDANVSLKVWNPTTEIELYGVSDISGYSSFRVHGPIGSYSYKAEVVGYGVTTETRSFYVNDTTKFTISPDEISWISVSDANSTYNLINNSLDMITLDSIPYIFKAQKEDIEENTTAILYLTPIVQDVDDELVADFLRLACVEVKGKIVGKTIFFNTSVVPVENYSAVIILSSPSELAVSDMINITVTDGSYRNKPLNYSVQPRLPLNSTHYARLDMDYLVLESDPKKVVNLHYVVPTDSGSEYNFTFEITANQTMDDTLIIEVNDIDNNTIYNETRPIHLEANVTQLVYFHVPMYDADGNLIDGFNVTFITEDFVLVSVLSVVALLVYGNLIAQIEYYYPSTTTTTIKCISSVASNFHPLLASFNIGITVNEIYHDIRSGKFSEACGKSKFPLLSILEELLKHPSRFAKYSKYAKGAPYIGLGASTWSCCKDLGLIAKVVDKIKNRKGLTENKNLPVGNCINAAPITTKFTNDLRYSCSPVRNVDNVFVTAYFPRQVPDYYRPFDTIILLNGHEIGRIDDDVPQGYYTFEADPDFLNYAETGVAENTLTLDVEGMNRGYSVPLGSYKIDIIFKQMKRAVCAGSQAEANQIIRNLTGSLAHNTDFAICPIDLNFSNTEPTEGEEITINATVYNLGTSDASNVIVQFYDGDTQIGDNQMVTYIPMFENETISTTWSGTKGSHRIYVKVNPDEIIQESDYTNNEAYKDIFVSEKTDFTPPMISNVNALGITVDSATITWDTDEESDSLVKYGKELGNYTFVKSDSNYVTVHNIVLEGLDGGTTYYYVVNSTDRSGNSNESTEYNFTTLPKDTIPPASVTNLEEIDKGSTWILWNWTNPLDVDFSHTMVYINGTFKANMSTSSHSYNTTNLIPNTTYEIGTRTVDSVGNVNETWVNDTATTLPDTIPPVITNVTVTNITTNSATISWDTDEVSDSLVKYGTTEGGPYPSEVLDPVNVKSHGIYLTGLLSNTKYYYAVNSTDESGNSAQSGERSFTTALLEMFIFDTGASSNPYPSIFGMHNGTIKPNVTIEVSKLYTYPCAGTGGHTEFAMIWNKTIGEYAVAEWNGYIADYHNISFNKTLTLEEGVIYNYTIHTGSYPQVHHKSELLTANGWINCTKFTDANGKEYNNWIPAIKLFL